MIYSKKSKNILYEGMKEVNDVVKKTFGPKGKNVIIDGMNTLISCDGFTVAKAITFTERLKNIGANMLINCAMLTKDLCGDGTTSTILLATEMISLLINNEINLDIDEVDNVTEKIINQIDLLSFPVDSLEELYKVAYTSSNSREIADIVSKVIIETGKFGAISIVPSYGEKIDYKVMKGIVYEKGFLPAFWENDNKIILKNAYVILVNDEINKVLDLENIIYDVKKSQKDILIVASGFSKEVVDYLVYLKKNNKINIVATKAPEYGNQSQEILEDIAFYLDAVTITPKTLFYTIDTIGKADFIEISDNKTIIQKTNIDNNKINKRIENLKEKLNDKPYSNISRRIAMLTNSIAYIYLPSQKDYEFIVRKEKLLNAINSTYSAYKDNAVIGAGYTLKKVYNELKKDIIGSNMSSMIVLDSLLKIYDTIGKNDDCFKEDDLMNVYDAKINLQTIVHSSVYLLKLFDSISDIILKEEKDLDSLEILR